MKELTEEEIILLEKLKAYFFDNFMPDVYEGGCETCGFGAIEGMSIKNIRKMIDMFIKDGGI